MVDRFLKIKKTEDKGNQYAIWLQTGKTRYKGNFEGLKICILENIISSYQEVKSKNEWKKLRKEDDFSDLLVHQMRQNELFNAFPVNREPQEESGAKKGYLDIKIDIPLCDGRYFAFECKKLNEKTGRSSLQQEYINEGIYRFVIGKYAQEEDFGGMVGFIISGEIKKIISNIRQKVKNYHFVDGPEDLLNMICDSFPTSFQSQHTRKNNLENIHIYHLFFDFKN